MTTLPPVTIILFLTGIAVWVEGVYHLGIDAEPVPGGIPATDRFGSMRATAGGPGTAMAGPLPVRAVGWIMLLAGLSDFVQAFYIMAAKPLGTPETVRLGGLVAIYAGFFTFLGIAQILGLDMRVVGDAAIPVGIVPLVYIPLFFADSWMMRSIIVIWGIAFIATWAHTHNWLSARIFGAYLVLVAIFTFFLPPALLALGHPLP